MSVSQFIGTFARRIAVYRSLRPAWTTASPHLEESSFHLLILIKKELHFYPLCTQLKCETGLTVEQLLGYHNVLCSGHLIWDAVAIIILAPRTKSGTPSSVSLLLLFPNKYCNGCFVFVLAGPAFASSVYVPSVPQHCSEAHGSSLHRCHEQNSYHGNNEYFFREGTSVAGSNWWQCQTRRCNWSACLYPFFLPNLKNFIHFIED